MDWEYARLFFRWSMPLFVMISGVLLFDSTNNEPITLFYKKRASRILVPLIFWTVFYLLFTYFGRLVAHGEKTSLRTLFGSVLYGIPYYHLWYLYMIIGFYFFAPYFLKIIRQSSYNELLILCAGLFAFSIGGNLFITYLISGQVPAVFTFIYYLPYFLAGYLISKTKIDPPLWLLRGIFIISGLINSFGYYVSFNPHRADFDYFSNALNIAVVPMSLSIMFLMKKWDLSLIRFQSCRSVSHIESWYLYHPSVFPGCFAVYRYRAGKVFSRCYRYP